MNPADIIKDAVALIKEYAQELSQKEHRDDVESGELIGYTEALFLCPAWTRSFSPFGRRSAEHPGRKASSCEFALDFPSGSVL